MRLHNMPQDCRVKIPAKEHRRISSRINAGEATDDIVAKAQAALSARSVVMAQR